MTIITLFAAPTTFIAVVVIVVVVSILISILGGWAYYAYNNPTTASGRWLIEVGTLVKILRVLVENKFVLKDGLPYLFHSFRNKYFNKISLGNMLYFQNKL